MTDTHEPPLRVISLHDLLYCERLFYLTEVENIQNPTALIYAGRRLHDDVVPLDDETPEHRSVEVGSDAWGIFGKVDAVRRRDGAWVAYEHKRGRCRRGDNNEVLPWPSDRIQAIAYAVLLEDAFEHAVTQARIRYHANNVTAFVEIDDAAREELRQAIDRARTLRRSTNRPPVTDNEYLCPNCSLAPVCLPEEERLAVQDSSLTSAGHASGLPVDTDQPQALRPAPKLFPADRQKQTLHIVSPKARVGRSGQCLVVTTEDGKEKHPVAQIDSVLIHGMGQITTQALQLCAWQGITVGWHSAGGKFIAGLTNSAGRVQQRIRQYEALTQPDVRLRLAKVLVHAKIETQLRYLLRATRGDKTQRASCQASVDRIRESLRKVEFATSPATLLGLEGMAAKAYFAALPELLNAGIDDVLRPTGRSRHPPRDRFNAALSFGYALVQSAVMRGLLAVGLEPAFGFYHQPRTAAPPLMMDVMELFRTSLWEMPLIASINRGQWRPDEDFSVTREHVWLSEDGRRKAIGLFEQRLAESYKHPHTGQSLSYARMIELEVRLLEKEWSGCPGMFAQLRLR